MAAPELSRPISDAEFNQVLGGILRDVSTFYRSEIQPLQNKKAALEARHAGLEARHAGLEARQAELDAKASKIQQEISEAREMQVRGDAMIAQGLQGLREVDEKKRHLLAEVFNAIFKKTTLTPADKRSIYEIYIANRELSLEKPAVGEGSYPQLNSMKSVIKYLDVNADIKTLDFRHFKDKINDVGTLSAYLADPSCRVTAVAFKASISTEAKASLEVSIAARNGALKVRYFT